MTGWWCKPSSSKSGKPDWLQRYDALKGTEDKKNRYIKDSRLLQLVWYGIFRRFWTGMERTDLWQDHMSRSWPKCIEMGSGWQPHFAKVRNKSRVKVYLKETWTRMTIRQLRGIWNVTGNGGESNPWETRWQKRHIPWAKHESKVEVWKADIIESNGYANSFFGTESEEERIDCWWKTIHIPEFAQLFMWFVLVSHFLVWMGIVGWRFDCLNMSNI